MAGEDGQRLDARRNREAVIDAAIRLFAEQEDASVQEIADASGVGRTTVYRHFPTRDDLFAAMFERAVEFSRERTSRALSESRTAEENLMSLASTMIDFGLEFRFLLSNAAAGKPALKVGRESSQSPVRVYVEAARERGELRSDFPVQWVMSVGQSLMIVALEDLVAGHMDESEAKELLGRTLIAALLPA
jgi:AcrR family transcriptional regulator